MHCLTIVYWLANSQWQLFEDHSALNVIQASLETSEASGTQNTSVNTWRCSRRRMEMFIPDQLLIGFVLSCAELVSSVPLAVRGRGVKEGQRVMDQTVH